MMPVANAVPLKAVCALEEVADSCVTDLRAKATQRSVAPARLWQGYSSLCMYSEDATYMVALAAVR